MAKKPIEPTYDEDEHGYQIALEIQKYDNAVSRLEGIDELRERIKDDPTQSKTLELIHEQGHKLFKEIEVMQEIIDSEIAYQKEAEKKIKFDWRGLPVSKRISRPRKTKLITRPRNKK